MNGIKILSLGFAIVAAVAQALDAADLNYGLVDELTGLKGKFNEREGAYKVTFPRADIPVTIDGWKFTIGRRAKMHGLDIDNTMGVNIWAAFAGTDDNAVVDGDFAVTEDELQSALKKLRAAGINIVAIHSHMTHEEPRILFFHYWGRGVAKQLAESIKSALPTSR